ncbi:MAG: hypothetical protein BWY81_01109 [Firmicutes bacterium ADurb.Bin467]|nr:MAG: hypothetical protein BWY81_01109 [Firmicutes bacterium ADurb.Bin467]
MKLFRLVGQFFGRRRHFLGDRRVLLNDLVQLLDRLVNLVHSRVLLSTGRADLLHEFGCLPDIRHHLLQHLSRSIRYNHARLGEVAYLGRGRLTPLGQFSHLGSDHGKALSVLSGPRRLDGCVQGKQVCLAGDLFDNGYLSGNVLHGRNRPGDRFAPFLGVRSRFPGNGLRLHGIVGVLFHIGGHLLHGRGSLLRCGSLLGRSLRRLLGRRTQLLAPHGYRIGGKLHVRDHARAVARAVLGVDHLDRRAVGERPLAVLPDVDLRHHAVLVQDRRALPRDAPDAQAVRAVREDLVVDDVVSEAEHLLDVRSRSDLLLKHEYARLADVRVQPLGNLELRARADHAAAFDAAELAALDLPAGQGRALERHGNQLPLADVRRAADDLQRFSLSDVDRADVQVVAVRVILAGEHAPDDDAVKPLAGLFNALDGRAGHDHARGIFLGGHMDVHIFPEPLHRYFHDVFPLTGTATGSAGRFRT